MAHGMTTDEVKDFILNHMSDYGCWLYVSAKTTNSHYMKFRDRRLGSLTVRDHPGRKKYHYKWNLILGYDGEKIIKKDGVTRYYYNQNQILQLCNHIKNYAAYMDRIGPRLDWSDKRRKRGRKQNVQESD